MRLSRRTTQHRLRRIYRRLWRAWGAQGWWPAATSFEVMVGAVLIQQTSWRHVERVIAQLKNAEVLTPRRLRGVSRRRLERLLRPVGYFRVKTRRLRALLDWLHRRWGDAPQRVFRGPLAAARAELLRVPGIGPETADAMLLYAGQRPVFVVDAYTRRILERHGLIRAGATYAEIQQLMHAALPRRVRIYNEYHALLVQLGKTHCQTVPRCAACPLETLPRVRGVWPIKHSPMRKLRQPLHQQLLPRQPQRRMPPRPVGRRHARSAPSV